jgi:hypothetical protein
MGTGTDAAGTTVGGIDGSSSSGSNPPGPLATAALVPITAGHVHSIIEQTLLQKIVHQFSI